MRDQHKHTYEESAGVAVFRNDPVKGHCLLTLLVHGKLDLPKGHIENKHRQFGNPILACASDELREETSLNLRGKDFDLQNEDGNVRLLSDQYVTTQNIDKKTGKLKKNVYIFAGETKTETIVILPNPKSGILEHDKAVWVPIAKIQESRLHEYLKRGIDWALDQYFANLNTQSGDLQDVGQV